MVRSESPVQRDIDTGDVVVLHDSRPVRAIRELQVKQLGVLLGLLEAVGRKAVLALRLDNSKGTIAQIRQEIVDALSPSAPNRATHDDDAPRGEAHLLTDLLIRPASVIERWNHVSTAGVGLSRQGRCGSSASSGTRREP